jgi:hypothetical protein
MRKLNPFILCSRIRKLAAMLLSFVFLFTSCVIYDKKSISIAEGVNEKKVKVQTIYNRKSAYQRIFYRDDGKLYGLTTKRVKDTLNIKIPSVEIDMIKAGSDPNISKDRITTIDGRTYGFDSYFLEDDTLYGKMKIKRHKEVLLMEEDIKGIYPYNKKKSTAGTVFLVIGMIPTGIILIGTVAVIIECWGKDCSGGWFSDGV